MLFFKNKIEPINKQIQIIEDKYYHNLLEPHGET